MDKENRKTFKICYIYDTETSNIIDKFEDKHIAYPILFIFNDVSNCKLSEYEADNSKEIIEFFRYEEEAIEYIDSCVEFGKDNDIVPVVCVYNAMFDILPILQSLKDKYLISCNAQSGTSIYTLDLIDENGDILLRFWDVFYLEPRGLSSMGESAGLEKATGEWDYDLVRTPQTRLTDQELYYAKRDVQVIPAYLRFLLESNSYINEEDFGDKLITKTSLIRLFGKRVTGQLEYENGKTVISHMYSECKRESAKTYESYALRKASFRGGLTFTSANYASEIQRNIYSLDVTSMHHTFICGRYVPCKFKTLKTPSNLNNILAKIKRTKVNDVLKNYFLPFTHAFHACVHLKNVRLKKNSVFEKEGIAILAESKFYKNAVKSLYEEQNKKEAILAVFKRGYKDRGLNVKNYYGKIYEADELYVYVNEIEWYCICLVYDFDEFECVKGEISYKFNLPPDFITLQSNSFFEQKSEMKHILKCIEKDEKIKKPKNNQIPDFIYEIAKKGKEKQKYLEEYYQVIVKGMFNAIYGSQAQDVNKPHYKLDVIGDIIIDDETIKTDKEFKNESTGLVNYVYGSRIVAGSRLHLLIAMMLIKYNLKDKCRILGGDTDSLKISIDEDVDKQELLNALKPLHRATKNALDRCMIRIREQFKEYASDLEELGYFEIENEIPYSTGVEYWNKCRMMRDRDGKFHITCAGVSRPSNRYNLEDIANRMYEYGIDEEKIYELLIGYNTTYLESVSHLLGHSKPKAVHRFIGKVKDYLGNIIDLNVHRSICLYKASKTIGDDLIETNYKNIVYKKLKGINVNKQNKVIYQDDEYIYIEIDYTLAYKIPKKNREEV